MFCNIHPTMSAVIVVLKSPYFSVSERNGAVADFGRSAGLLPAARLSRTGHRTNAGRLVTRWLKFQTDGLQLPAISVSESGYLQLPHKNKFGKDYPPVTDSGGYVGTKP